MKRLSSFLQIALLLCLPLAATQPAPPVNTWHPKLPAMALGLIAHQGTLWVVGDHAMIASSADGGQTWITHHKSGSGQMLFDIQFVNDRLAFAAGSMGEVWRSEDGGQHWKRIARAPKPAVRVRFSGEKHGLLATTHGFEFTTNGKKFKGMGGPRLWIQSIAATDAQHLLVAYADNANGSPGPAPFLDRSSDGGKTWTRDALPEADIRYVLARNGRYTAYALRHSAEGSSSIVNASGRLLELTSAHGAHWQVTHLHAEARPNCTAQGCLTANGWIELDRAQPIFWTRPAHVDFAPWAAAKGSFCSVSSRLMCSLTTKTTPQIAQQAPTSGLQSQPDNASLQPAVCRRCPSPAPEDVLAPGRVMLSAEVGIDGHLHRVRLLSAVDAEEARAVLRNVRKKWRYRPAMLDGKPRPQTVISEIVLKDRHPQGILQPQLLDTRQPHVP